MKPIIKYRGGKSKEIPQIIQYIPQFDGRYIEPFLGGGAMFFHLEPNNAIINDINVRLINFYRSVQQDFMQLSMELAELENIYSNNRLEFDKLKKLHPEDRIPDENETLYYQLRDMYVSIQQTPYFPL